MELFHFPMCMLNTMELKILLGKSYGSFDTGMVKKLRKFQYWAKKLFYIKLVSWLELLWNGQTTSRDAVK